MTALSGAEVARRISATKKREEGGGLIVLGWGLIVVACLLVALLFAGSAPPTDADAGVILSTFASGVVLISFGRAIRLLGNIADAVERTEITERVEMVEPPQFFYEVAGEARGPVTLADLATMRALPSPARIVTGETLVCLRGSAKWERLATIQP